MFEGWFAHLAEALLSGGRLVLGTVLSTAGRVIHVASVPEGSVDTDAPIPQTDRSAPRAPIGAQKRMSGAVALESDAIEPTPPRSANPRSEENASLRDEEPSVSPILPRLPEADRLTVLARDPETLFAYWEIRPQTRAQALASLGAPPEATSCEALRIRVADAAPGRGTPEPPEWILELPPLATSRYVESMPPGERLQVSLGLLFEDRFVPLASARAVSTPPRTACEDHRAVWRQLAADRRPSKSVVASPTILGVLDAGFELPDLDGLASSSSTASESALDGTSRSKRR